MAKGYGKVQPDLADGKIQYSSINDLGEEQQKRLKLDIGDIIR